MDEPDDDAELSAVLDRRLRWFQAGAVLILLAVLGLGVSLVLRALGGGGDADLVPGGVLVVTAVVGLVSAPRMLRIDDERRARGLDVLREQRDGTWRPPVSDPGRKAAFNIVGSVIGSAFAVFGVVGLARDGATSGAVLLTCLGLLLGAGNMWGARHFLRIRRQRMTEAGDEQG